MSEYHRVIDKYWIEFLESAQSSNDWEERIKPSEPEFWIWFYRGISWADPSRAKRLWKEAQE